MQVHQNVIADILKMLIDIAIGISQHGKTLLIQKAIPVPVIREAVRLEMLRSVKLDDQTRRINAEINDIGSNYKLPLHRYVQSLEKIIPQMPFLFGHVSPESLRVFGIDVRHRYISIVEIEIVISSSTSSSTRTVSSAVKIVTLFSTAQRRISKPSVWLDWLEMSRVLIT